MINTLTQKEIDDFWEQATTNNGFHSTREESWEMAPTLDVVNHPVHYTSHKSGIECIQITEHMSFLMGNAMKYLWRADLKNGVEDLQKAIFYIKREIEQRTKRDNPSNGRA